MVTFCKSCHVCQMTRKPNQTPQVDPLVPIPVMDEPFSRAIIDCVGPLARTRNGNQYLLMMMCMPTIFLEAIPLRNIKAPNIVKGLIKLFTLVGLPKSIQSDQESNFISGVFQQVMYELGVKQYTSSAYHPQSQGALERFHQTLKSMLHTYCFEQDKDWDEGVHLLLFAAHEAVQESLGFSPFELLFTRYWYRPCGVTNADSSLALLVRGTCQYPFKRSRVVTYLALPILSMQSSILSNGKESAFVTAFNFLKSVQKR